MKLRDIVLTASLTAAVGSACSPSVTQTRTSEVPVSNTLPDKECTKLWESINPAVATPGVVEAGQAFEKNATEAFRVCSPDTGQAWATYFYNENADTALSFGESFDMEEQQFCRITGKEYKAKKESVENATAPQNLYICAEVKF